MHRYPVYKDSGIEWLGEVPEEWDIHRIKYRVDTNAKSLPEDTDPDYCFRYVDIGNVDQGHITVSPEPIFFADAPSRARRIVAQGDTIVSTVRTYLKAIAYVDYTGNDLVVSTGFAVLTPRKSVISKFVYYLMSCEKVIDTICSLSVGVSYPAINSSDLTSMPLWFPPKSEQQDIVIFLDKKTAIIDELIAKKQRQIELLKEQRQAVINQAVTKGLDPDVKMKDSGIDWLGKIPEHWGVRRLKYVSPEITVGIVVTPAKYYVDIGVPCLRSLNIKALKISDENMVFISTESNELLKKSMIFEGDLVSVRTGQPGTTAVVDSRFDKANCIDLIVMRRSSLFDSTYMAYQLNSSYAKGQYDSGSGGAIQQHFNIETAKNLLVIYPPIEEQKEIRDYLIKQDKIFHATMNTDGQQVNLLQEYRTALISEAVTGKIDARSDM